MTRGGPPPRRVSPSLSPGAVRAAHPARLRAPPPPPGPGPDGRGRKVNATVAVEPPPKPPLWNAPPLPATTRVDALIDAMTLQEKTGQLFGVWVGASDQGGE